MRFEFFTEFLFIFIVDEADLVDFIFLLIVAFFESDIL